MIVEILDYNSEIDICKVNNFLMKSKTSVVQQYPIIKCLYTNNNEKFYYLICKENEDIIGVFPFVIYFNSNGNIIQSNPIIGYGGVLVENSEKRERTAKLLIDKMLEIGKKNECILVTIGTSILDENLELYKNIFEPNYIKENFYQYNILDKLPIDKLKSKKKCVIRRQINICLQNNIKVKKNENKFFKEWYDIYLKRFNEIGASALPFNLLGNMVNTLCENNLADFYYVFWKEKLIGGTFVIYNHNVIDYFASTYKTEFMNLYSNQFVINEIHKWSLTKGIKIFNWESSPQKDSGVYEFKKRWGALDGNHYYLTKVIGDISKIKKNSIDSLKRQYKGYYLMPYEFLK